MADQTQQYTLTQAGGTLGSSYVTTAANQTSPQRETTIISFECPRKFEKVSYVGKRDPTRFIPRTTESITGTTGDDTVVSLQANIQPVSGETEIAEQDYPVAVAYNVTTDTEYDIAAVDYATNEVTLGTNPSDGDTVKVWPIISEGDVQYRITNQFGQPEGTLYPWATPIHKWHDFKQLQRGREVNLSGSGSFQEHEKLEFRYDGPQAITWEDADYPQGEYVSTFEQDVEITL